MTTTEPTYPLAPQGVFWTVQGEGSLAGEPMVFVRLAGCPVGCPECDTDYSVHSRVGLGELARLVAACDPTPGRWVWLTGGEPTLHDLPPLCARLNRYGYRVAVATAGVKPVRLGSARVYDHGPAFLSVSPHFADARWVQRSGDQVNLVPGLNGLRLEDFEGIDFGGFNYRYVTPLWYAPSDRAERVAECVEWVRRHKGWRLGCQSHKALGVA